MINFIIGLVVGIFLMPTIKETHHWLCIWKPRHFLREPLEFIKDVWHRTFIGGY